MQRHHTAPTVPLDGLGDRCAVRPNERDDPLCIGGDDRRWDEVAETVGVELLVGIAQTARFVDDERLPDKVFEQEGQTQIRDVERWVGANENCPDFGEIDVLDVAEAQRLTSVLVGVSAPSTRSRVAVDEFDIGRHAVPHVVVAFLSGKHQPE
jgi:hypothetical protein